MAVIVEEIAVASVPLQLCVPRPALVASTGPTDLSFEQASLIQAWLSGPTDLETYATKTDPGAWVEVYRGTRDGFGADDFHSKCDDKPHLLVLVKEKEAGWLFGGYTAVGYVPPRGDSRYATYADPAAFVFALTNPCDRPERLASRGGGNEVHYAPCCSAVFGDNDDLLIYPGADIEEGSYTQPGGSFEAPTATGSHPMAQGLVQWQVAEVIAWTVPQ